MAKASILKPFAWIVAIALVGGVGYWAAVLRPQRDAATAPAEPEKVPVSIAIADRTDLPIYLDSLGQVQAWNTITVRSRVDGEILNVAFKEGQTVKEGDLLVQIDPRPFQAVLDQAVAKRTQDASSLGNAQRDLKRYERVGTLAASQQQIDTQRASVAQIEAILKSDDGAIDNAKVQLGYTSIKSPLTGRAGLRLVDQGNIVHAGDAGGIVRIAQMQPIAVLFTEPQEQLPHILEGLKSGALPVTALTTDTKKELGRGELSLVDNQVDQATGSIRLKAKFANEAGLLWPGLTVTTRLLIRTEKNVVVIPDAAVQRGPDHLFAYVVGDDDKVAARELEVGEIEEGSAVIKSGVAAGDRVVTSGYYRLKPGAAVEIRGPSEPKSNRTTASDAAGASKSPAREVE